MPKSIVVIADDFTGAAELAGISLQYGLQLPIFLNAKQIDQSMVSQGCIISTDSRSMYQEEALEITQEVMELVQKWNPDLLYKKIDSVLRGYVLEELAIQMNVLSLKKALIAPANPNLGRVIKEGIYYIKDQPIAETGFANDPEFPIESSYVKDMLQQPSLQVVKHMEDIPTEGIFIAEATNPADTINWADLINEQFALAGAGDFYSALLAQSFKSSAQKASPMQKPFLLVVGTAFDTAKERVISWRKNAKSILRLQNYFELIELKDAVWILNINNKGIQQTALNLRNKMAIVVKDLVCELDIQELVIEGGSTAAAILKALEINQLIPIHELSRGVVRMKADELFITVKPGSYQLPTMIESIMGQYIFLKK